MTLRSTLSALGRFFGGNLRDKLFALAAAVLLWYYLAAQTHRTVGPVIVPVQITGLPAGAVATFVDPPGTPTRIEVHLNGPEGDLRRILDPRTNLVARITAPVTALGEQQVFLSARHFRLDPGDVPLIAGVTVRTTPERVIFRVVDQRERWVPVHPVLVGKPAEGRRVIEARCEPNDLLVAAPGAFFEGREWIPTGPVNVDGKRTSFSREVEVPRQLDGYPLSLKPRGTVTVRIEIGEEEATRSVALVPVLITVPPDFPYRIRLDVPTVVLTIRGPAARVRDVGPKDLEVSVTMDGAVHRPREGDLPYRGRASVQAPPGVTVANIPEITFVVLPGE